MSSVPSTSGGTTAGMASAHPSVTVITPHRGWFDWRLRQLWRYRDLISLFVWRDFVSVYKQTILGPVWHIIRPLLTTVVFTLVFGLIVGVSTDGAPRFLFYMVGNIAWTFFATTLDNTAKTFVSNHALLGKVYFHRLVIPISLVISSLIAFGIQFGILLTILGFYVAAGHALQVTVWALLIPVLLLLLAGYSLGGGIIVCAMTTHYRDLSYLVTFGIQLLMFITPVIFPISAVPERYRWLMYLNPLTPVFEGFRLGLLGVGTVSLQQIAISAVVMSVILATGMLLFTRVERTFVDTV